MTLQAEEFKSARDIVASFNSLLAFADEGLDVRAELIDCLADMAEAECINSADAHAFAGLALQLYERAFLLVETDVADAAHVYLTAQGLLDSAIRFLDKRKTLN